MQHLQFIKQLSNGLHPGWNSFLTKQTCNQLVEIEAAVLKTNFTPAAGNVLRFLGNDPAEIKVVILGQDPYPQQGVATGRAFEVATLKSWNEPFRNISLKNIVRLLYKTYRGEAIKYNEIKAQLGQNFHLLPPDKLFGHWEEQGVLLLNTAFTCKIGEPGSHAHLWNVFTHALLAFLSERFQNIHWFIWGNHAEKAVAGLELKHAHRTMHPMMCFRKAERTTDFLFGKENPFAEMKQQIDWTGFGNQKIAATPDLFNPRE